MPRPGTDSEMRRLISFLRNSYRECAEATRARKCADNAEDRHALTKSAYDRLHDLERLAHLVAADAVVMRNKLQRESDIQL